LKKEGDARPKRETNTPPNTVGVVRDRMRCRNCREKKIREKLKVGRCPRIGATFAAKQEEKRFKKKREKGGKPTERG